MRGRGRGRRFLLRLSLGVGTAILFEVSLGEAAAFSPDARQMLAAAPEAGRILEVPFIAQERFQCGPASVAMVLRYYGVPAEVEAIAKEFESEQVAGTFTVDLLIAAVNAGMEAHWQEGDPESLRAEINAGRPVIVFLNLAPSPLPGRHFAVAVGYVRWAGRDHIVLHSGQKAFVPVSEKKFLRQWNRTSRMMMTVKPPSLEPAPPPRPAEPPETPPSSPAPRPGPSRRKG